MKRIIEINIDEIIHYEVQDKFLFWWKTYTYEYCECLMNYEFSTIEEALRFIERIDNAKINNKITKKVVWQSNKH